MQFLFLLSTIASPAFAHDIGESASNLHHLESPFGISFGPTAISASRFNAIGHIEVSVHPADVEYQQRFDKAVQDYGVSQDRYSLANYEGSVHETAKAIFYNALKPLTETLQRQLGHDPEFGSVITASVMSGYLSHAAANAVFGGTTDKTVMYGTPTSAAQMFGFVQCKHLGRQPEECHDDGPMNSILFLEYENDYLFAWFMVVDFDLPGYPTYHNQICKECGEKYRNDIGNRTYEERLKHFVDEAVAKTDTMEWHARKDLRVLLIAGEASAYGVERLAEIAREVIGNEYLNYVTEVESSMMVAHGAAVWARATQLEPENFGVDVVRDYPKPEHDEL